VQTRNPDLETDVVVYEPVSDRVARRRASKALRDYARLHPPQRRIAWILANYPSRDGRLATMSARYPS